MLLNRGKLLSLREVFVLILLALPLLVAVSTIEAAHWVRGLPSLKVLVLVSLVMWAFLARSAVPGWIAHPVAFVVGLVVALILGSFTLSGQSGLMDMGSRLGDWFGAIGSSEGDRGAVVTGVGLIALTLWMGHFTVWLAYKQRLAVLAVLPGLGVLLIVLTFLTPDFYWYFFMYVLAAAPGIAYRHNGRWSLVGRRAPLLGSLVAGLALMAVTLVPVWRSPSPEGTVIPLASKFDKQWYSFQAQWSNLFYGVPNRKEWRFFSPDYYLPISGPIQQGNEVMFMVESKQPYRWRMRVYEHYTSSGWVNEKQPVEVVSKEVSLQGYVEALKARKKVEIGVRIFSKASTLVSVGEPIEADISYDVELSPKPSFKVYVDGPQFSYLPPSVEDYRDGLVSWLKSDSEVQSIRDRLIPGVPTQSIIEPTVPIPGGDPLAVGFQRTGKVGDFADGSGEQLRKSAQPDMFVERVSSIPGPPLALLGKRLLVPPQEYQTEGSISTATPAMLRRAAGSYPDSITDRYLQLPNDFPETVKQLARDLTRDENNAYDKAEAIRLHLLALPYTLDVIVPPEGRDWVEYFLTEVRQGYCQNYASAMITMLRTLGIPARLVVGFAPGIWNQQRGEWEVQAQQYHAWPEVYFPAYGWVEFEPTPADVQPALEQLGIPRQGILLATRSDFDDCLEDFLFEDCDVEGSSAVDLLDLLDEDEPVGADALSEDASNGGGLGFLSSAEALLGLGLALPALIMVGIFSYAQLSMSRLEYATTRYAFMGFLGRLAGLGRLPQETPWEYSTRLGRALPDRAQYISHITDRFVAHRYGSPTNGSNGQGVGSLRLSWRAVRRALLARILLRPFQRRRRPAILD